MRAFVVLCLVAVASADKLGYNYQPVGHSSGGLSFTPGSGGTGSDLSGDGLSGLGGLSGFGGLGAPSSPGGSVGGIGGGDDSNIGSGDLDYTNGGNLGSGDAAPAGGAGDYDAPSSYDAPATFEKEFFTYTAPENEFDDPLAAQKVSKSLNRGLRVVFIKGPENRGLEDAALALAKQAAEQQTAIYVLNKQTDLGDLANKLNALRSNKNNKPDVHFVKYRTPEDAANAQKAIQSQYDQLGGSSSAHDGGVAPVINFASKGPARQVAPARQPDNSYLPSSVFRRF